MIFLAFINFFGANIAIKSENLFNILKMCLLAIFIVFGFMTPIEWGRMAPANYGSTLQIVSGAMIIFLNYEGFELIANAGKDIANPKRALPIAYIGGVLIVIGLYILIAVVVVGHMDFNQIARYSDYALSVAAKSFMGDTGFVMIAIAALLATSSAINATFYGSGRLTFTIAKYGELPSELEKNIRNQPLEGMIIFAVLTLIFANIIPLQAIATMGSAGFLLIFMAVNIANIVLSKETKSITFISVLGAIACAIALFSLSWQTWQNSDTRNQLWILVAMIVISVLIEIIYRVVSKREIHMGHSRKNNTRPSI